MIRLRLAALLCAVAGVSIFTGSAIGGFWGRSALFLGAATGGYVGIHIASKLAQKLGLIERRQLRPVMFGAICGFGTAEALARWTLSNPVAALASLGLVGLGGLVGLAWSNRGKDSKQESPDSV